MAHVSKLAMTTIAACFIYNDLAPPDMVYMIVLLPLARCHIPIHIVSDKAPDAMGSVVTDPLQCLMIKQTFHHLLCQ